MNPFFRVVCRLGFVTFLAGVAHATYLDDIGYTQLQAELGSNLPDGSGVAVSQIEAQADPLNGNFNYRPNTASPQFSGITFTFPDASGLSTAASSHATTVGSYFYGSSSMAGGVTNVASYEANSWINAWLNGGSSVAPAASLGKVQNFSWIGTTGSISSDVSLLARMDYAIARDNVLAVFGLNNGVGSVPNLMASGFNGISVGLSNGNASYGTTHLTGVPVYGQARRKPELVAPASATSWATGIVSSAGTMLVDAGTRSGNANSVRTEVLKATLMAGATKTEFADWHHTTTDPLDDKYGAGELNIANSYHIQASGEQDGQSDPVSDVSATGWDLGAVASSSMFYFFDLSQEGSFSAVLTWNIEVIPNGSWSSLDFGLENLDLKLYEATAFTIGDKVAESVASIGNVELLWSASLSSGRYVLEVSSPGLPSTDYGLAWASAPVPEPNAALLLLLGGAVVLVVCRSRPVSPGKCGPSADPANGSLIGKSSGRRSQ